MTRLRAVLSVVLAGVCAQGAAADPTPREQLQEVQQNLDAVREEGRSYAQEASGFHGDVVKLQRAMVTAARNVQDSETQVTEIEHTLDRLHGDETTQASAWEQERQHEAAILAALERVATTPPVLITVAPGSPIDVARSGILLGAAVPALQQEALQLAAALDQLRRTQADILARHSDMLREQQVLDQQQQQLAGLIAQKRALEGATSQKAQQAQARAAALIARANDLQQVIDRLDRAGEERNGQERAKATQPAAAHTPSPAPAAPPAASVAAGPGPAGGHLATPAAGEIIKHFGDQDGASGAKGVSYETRASARIVAPASGEVLFAGPFKGYGQILIIDHGEGYHSLLAGLGKIECAVGQKVSVGEPVGLMPAEGTPVLYFEVRRQNQPVDPLPWLGARDQKVSG